MTTTRAWSVTRPMMSAARCLGEGSLEGWPAGDGEEPVEVLRGIRDEVAGERRDALLEHAPHRLAEVRDDPHERDPGKLRRADRARVGREERLVLIGLELVVDREVAEVEERVTHARVLPVDDPHPRPVVDEVRVEQV